MLIVLKNNQPNGVAYNDDKPEYHAHHAQYGEKCVWLPGLVLERDENGECTTTLSLDQLKQAKLAEIASSRYEAETAGITVNGATIATDRTSQALITGAALKATQDGTYTCQWKTAQGFVTLTAAQILAIADAVRDHVQGCFDQEATLAGQVEAVEINETTTLAQALAAVNAIAWLDPE